MLIIEGPDMVGKTQLCADVLRELAAMKHVRRLEYSHLSSEAAAWPLDRYKSEARTWRVQDRWHLSDAAYSAAVRDGSSPVLTPGALESLSQWLAREVGMVMVLILPSKQDYDALMLSKAQEDMEREMYSIEQNMAVLRAFHALVDTGRLRPNIMLRPRCNPVYPGGWYDENQARLVAMTYERAQLCTP